MKKWTSYILKNKLFRIFGLLFTAGLIIGIIYFLFQTSEIKGEIRAAAYNYINTIQNGHINTLVVHTIILIITICLSNFLIGVIIYSIFIVFEAISSGFILATIIYTFKIKGLLFYSLFVIFFKLIFWILLFLLFIKMFKITILKTNILFKKSVDNNKISIYNTFSRTLILLLIIIFNDFLIYLYSPYILSIITKIL